MIGNFEICTAGTSETKLRLVIYTCMYTIV